MTEEKYRLSIATIPLSIDQGVTYYRRWQIRYQDTLEPFPFFDDQGQALWTGRCMVRIDYADSIPLLELTTENDGIILDTNTVDTVTSVFYSIMITAEQTAALPAGKYIYDLEFQRISDDWVIRIQKGKIVVNPEVTK